VIIRPREEGLTLHTIFYANEVRAIPEYGLTKNVEVKPQEVALAQQLVESLAAPFDPEKYEDAYQQKLLSLIEAKKEGKAVHETKGKKLAPVIDLMAALQKSLAAKAANAAAAENEEDEDAADGRKPARRAAAAANKSAEERPATTPTKRRRAAS